MKRIKNAFTMIELIFVIIILGIVSSIGASLIANVYESYIIQRAVHNASVRTELAINQLANRLTYRIDSSMIARIADTSATPAYTPLPAANPTIYKARSVPLDKLDSHRALEWISYDNDSFAAYSDPAWSGFTDLNTTITTELNIHTPGSDTSKLTTNYNGAQRRAMVFLGASDYKDDGITREPYKSTCMYNANGCIFPVSIGGGQSLTLGVGAGNGDRVNNEMIYTEFYQLANSAYAVVPDNNHTLADTSVDVYDLKLYYGYQPWLGEHYKSGQVSTLLKDVSVFRFKKESNAIRIKLCTVERLGDSQTISICKEKAVIR